jgi:N-methylhydantoinase A
MPVVRIHTIGAGGGSVGYVEAGGLRVGPRSAGAEPGPACYGRGGSEPTVTDANLVLGRVDPAWFAGGTVQLDTQAAHDAVGRLAGQLGLGSTELAEGICAVINTKMAQAIRTITVEKGLEPRDYTLLAYGGAGPMHACFLARELGIDRVIVPSDPGAFSAWGMLETDLRQDFAEAMFAPLDRLDTAQLVARLREMADEGMRALAAQGVATSDISHHYAVDMRYRGQEYNLTVPLEAAEEAAADDFTERLAGRFHAAYQRRFGHSNPGAPAEIVIVRSAVTGAVPRRPLAARELDGAAPPGRPTGMIFDGRPVDALAYGRLELAPGSSVTGPALVVERTATTVLPPGWRMQVDALGFLQLSTHEAGK